MTYELEINEALAKIVIAHFAASPALEAGKAQALAASGKTIEEIDDILVTIVEKGVNIETAITVLSALLIA